MTPLLYLSVFLATSLGVAAAYALVSDYLTRDETKISQRVDEGFRERQRDKVRKSKLFKNLGDFGGLDPTAAARDLWGRLEEYLEQAGLEWTPRQLLTAAWGTGLALGVVGGVLRGPTEAALGVLAGLAGPVLYVRYRWSARREKFITQLPEAFDLMARVVRAGNSVQQALQAVSEAFDPPLSIEFAFCQEQQNLGLLPEVSYKDLARRAGILEVKIFVMAMLIQRQTGGNLAEVLERLAGLVRDRLKLKNHVKSLTAEGRMQAAVLMALPPFMFGVLYVLNRSYALVLFEHPQLLMLTGAAMVVGALWIRSIVNIEP